MKAKILLIPSLIIIFGLGYKLGTLPPQQPPIPILVDVDDEVMAGNSFISGSVNQPVCDSINNAKVDKSDKALKDYMLERNGCPGGAGPAGPTPERSEGRGPAGL